MRRHFRDAPRAVGKNNRHFFDAESVEPRQKLHFYLKRITDKLNLVEGDGLQYFFAVAFEARRRIVNR